MNEQRCKKGARGELGRWASVGALALGSTLVFGCAPSSSRRVQTAVDQVQKETTPDKLEARGDLSAMMGDGTRSEQYYAAALNAGGDAPRLTRKLITACSIDRRYPAAILYAQEYLQKHPGDADVRFAWASLNAAVGEDHAAEEGFLQVLKERPNFADAHYALARLWVQSGRANDTTHTHFREYLRLRPDGPYAEAARAELLRETNP